jgi:hypothetical protein
VGSATHYHADYVFPRWGPTMVKITQIGQHIFYRFPGPVGRAEILTGRYGGGELRVSMAGPPREAIAALKAAAEAAHVPIQSFTVADATAPGGVRERVAGQVIFGRRVPTKDEIARINASLAAMEDRPAPPPVIVAPQPGRKLPPPAPPT